jgi:hypothetical protein
MNPALPCSHLAPTLRPPCGLGQNEKNVMLAMVFWGNWGNLAVAGEEL